MQILHILLAWMNWIQRSAVNLFNLEAGIVGTLMDVDGLRWQERRISKRNGQAQQHDSGNKHESSAVDQAPQPKSHDNYRNEQYRREFWSRRRVVCVELLLTAVIAGSAIMQALVARWQWDALAEQNKEFAKSNELIGKQLGQMEWQNIIMIEQGLMSSEQLGLARKAIEQTQITIGRTALDSRAWVSPTRVTLHNDAGNATEIKAEERVWAYAPLKNYGKTPAYITGVAVELEFFENDSGIPKHMATLRRAANAQKRSDAIASESGIDFPVPPRIFLPEEIGAIVEDHPGVIDENKPHVFLVGVAVYRDVYEGTHRTEFCFSWDIAIKRFVLYPKYQYMD